MGMDQTAPFCLLLLGQPTLRRKLRQGTFTALDQRIAVRYAINGLSAKETQSYVQHHLALALALALAVRLLSSPVGIVRG
jgi:type II secretory pathway predicted ATPase ExeA